MKIHLDKENLLYVFSIGFIILIVGFVVVIVAAHLIDYITTGDYTYVDMDGNSGVADVCTQERGLLWCKSGDRKVIVKEYQAR